MFLLLFNYFEYEHPYISKYKQRIIIALCAVVLIHFEFLDFVLE